MFDFVTSKREWKAHKKQEQAIVVPNSVIEVLYGGAAGGGKSELGIAMPLVKKCKYSNRMWYQHPMFKALIIRRTIPELKKELVKRCYQFYPQTGAQYNKSDRVWSWSWGAQLYLAAAEHEEDIRRFDTEQFNYIFVEESTSFTEFMYVYLLSRLRPADEDLPSLMFSATTPGNIGHGWVRKRFVEPYKEGGKVIRQYFFDKSGNYLLNAEGEKRYIDRIFIKALPTDNPHVLKNDPDYLNKLEALPEAERAAKLGDWWTFSGQVFDSFRAKKYPDEPENALHVISPIIIPDWWPRILAIDWGYKAATVAYWGAISPDGRVYVYREYYVRETDVAVWGTEIGEMSRGENIRCLVLDTNAWENRGEPKTIAVQFQEHFTAAYGDKTLTAEQASKGRISGKVLAQEYMRWKPKPVFKNNDGKTFDPEEALRLKRVSENAWARYVELFAPPDVESNLPRLQIFNTCTQLIECIPLCVYDDKNVEDVKEWQVSDNQVGDDPYDCMRYLLKRIDRYIKESHNEFVTREREQVVIQHLATTGDMTGYYRRMEHLEKKGSNARGTIKRLGAYTRIFRRAM